MGRGSSDSAPASSAAADGGLGSGRWEKHVDDATGAAYYHNPSTGETTWEAPEGFVDDENEEIDGDDEPSSSTAPAAKSPRWRRYRDTDTGKTYFYDEANDRTQWEEPEGEIADASSSDDEGEDAEEEDESSHRQVEREPPVKDQEPSTGAPEGANDDNKNGEYTLVATARSPTGVNDSAAPSSATAAPSESTTAPTAATALTSASTSAKMCNWIQHLDRATGKPYYHDTVSGRTQWEAPPKFTAAASATTPTMSPEYLEYLHRSRAEAMARVTQRALDPEGHLSRLNAVLSKIGDGDAPVPAPGVDATTGDADEQPLEERARAEWQQHVDPQTKRFYYHNLTTGVTQWHKPDAPIASALGDWVPPETEAPREHAPTVSGHKYTATAKFNRVTGKYEKLGGDAYWQAMGIASDREGRQMSHFFDTSKLEENREEAKRIKEQLKRKNIDWKKVAAEKKAKKQKQRNEWLFQD